MIDEDKTICVGCATEGTIPITLHNMQWKEFMMCTKCLLVLQRVYTHGECSSDFTIDEIPETMLEYLIEGEDNS